jgi:hypothetical protein
MTKSPNSPTRRDQWESVADRLLDRAMGLRSEHGSLIEFEGPRFSDNGWRSDGLEGFARSFWLAACRMKHAEASRRNELATRYAEGLSAGWNPSLADAWPDVSLAQTMVECGSLGFGLWATREWIWDTLPQNTKNGLVDYLLRGVSRPLGNGNWLLFRVIVQSVLRSLGIAVDPSETVAALDLIDGSYRGNGWYSDGGSADSTKFDYYNAWSMNMYPLLWSLIEGDRVDPARSAEYRARSGSHVETMLSLIGGDGAPLFQGRSLTYRAAMVSSMWAAELAGVEGLDHGQILRASSLALGYFDSHGGFDGDQASLGWHTEYEPMTQRYSGPGSPLWLSKGFLGLLLPPDAEVWTTAERPLPIESGSFLRAEQQPGWIVQGTQSDGIIRVVNHGTSRLRSERGPHYLLVRDDPDYARIAYSNVTAPLFDGAMFYDAMLDDATFDSSGAQPTASESSGRTQPQSFAGLHDNDVIIEEAGVTSVRQNVSALGMGEGWAVSEFRLELPESPGSVPYRCRLISLCHGDVEVRLARTTAPIRGTRMTGWMIADDAGVEASVTESSATVRAVGGVTGDLTVVVGTATVSIEAAPPGVFGTSAAYPAALFSLEAPGAVIGVAVRLGRTSNGFDVAAPQVQVGSDTIAVTWADGSTSAHDEAARLFFAR